MPLRQVSASFISFNVILSSIFRLRLHPLQNLRSLNKNYLRQSIFYFPSYFKSGFLLILGAIYPCHVPRQSQKILYYLHHGSPEFYVPNLGSRLDESGKLFYIFQHSRRFVSKENGNRRCSLKDGCIDLTFI